MSRKKSLLSVMRATSRQLNWAPEVRDKRGEGGEEREASEGNKTF
jgi:hypothetical protein